MHQQLIVAFRCKHAMICLTRGTVWGIWFIILLFNVPLLRKKKKKRVCAGVRVWSGNGSWLLFFPCMVTARVAWDSAGRPGRRKTQSVNVRKGPPLTSKQRSWPADEFNQAIYFCAPSPVQFPKATRWCYPETRPNSSLTRFRLIVRAAKMAQCRRETIKCGFVILLSTMIELCRGWRNNLLAPASDFQTLSEVIKMHVHGPRSTEYDLHRVKSLILKTPVKFYLKICGKF